ncbi:MAG: PD40 domain-containing protein [Magnetococcales bacterium]|nr:PD40 domain-containing protein [Magnetococcales bacterium]
MGAPSLIRLTPEGSSSSSTSYVITNSTVCLVTGSDGVSGATLVLFDDVDYDGALDAGEQLTLVADNNGDGIIGGGETLSMISVSSTDWSARALLTSGAHYIRAMQTTSGVTSSASNALIIVVDTAAPPSPTALDLAAVDDLGFFSDDNITRQTSSLTISGSGSEAGSTLTLFDDKNNDGVVDSGESLVTTSVTRSWNASGDAIEVVWKADISLAVGSHRIRTIETDLAGNSSVASSGISISVDTTAPSAPTGLDLAAIGDTGVNTDNITSLTTGLTITVNGSEVGSFLVLFDDKDNDSVIDRNEVLATSQVTAVPWGVDGRAMDPFWCTDGSTIAAEWSTDINLAAGTHTLRASAFDLAGNCSEVSSALVITVDTTPVPAPTNLDLAAANDTGRSSSDNITSQRNGLVISGSGGIVGAALKLFNDRNDSDDIQNFYRNPVTGQVENNGELLAEPIVVSAVSWSIKTKNSLTARDATLQDGTYNIKVMQTALGVETISSSLIITVDTTAPSVQKLGLAVTDDTGISNNDGITRQTSALTIEVEAGSDGGSTVLLFDDQNNDSIVGSGELLATADVLKTWSTDVNLAAGTHSIRAIATDIAGNSSISGALIITIDTTPPSAPTSLDLATASDTGSSGSDNITSKTRGLTINGDGGVIGAALVLFDDMDNDGVVDRDELLATTQVKAAEWSVDTGVMEAVWSADVSLSSGTHAIRAIATDIAGNNSTASTAFLMTVDTVAPLAPTNLDLAAEDDTGSSSNDNVTSLTGGLTISGNSGENGGLLLLFDDRNDDGIIDHGELLATASITANVWSADISLSAGTHNIRALAVDRAGNMGQASRSNGLTIFTNPTVRSVSVTGEGMGDGESGYYSPTSLSADGRFTAFMSYASNLVAGDNNGEADVFVYDRFSNNTSRISVSSGADETDRKQGNDWSFNPSISANGNWVAFVSEADNLVSGDNNNAADVFVYDRSGQQTSRISIASDGVQGNGWSSNPSLSADGSLVAFWSEADNLVSGDNNDMGDIFLFDRTTNQTSRASVSGSAAQSNGWSYDPAISADGRFVTFWSYASNLVSGDNNSKGDVFVYDRTNQQTSRISVASDGTQGNGDSSSPSISADGRFVAFVSWSDNLVSGDSNAKGDVFVYDRQLRKTSRISISNTGVQGNDWSWYPSISANGRFVTFMSQASNLVSGDNNGSGDVFVYDRTLKQTNRISLANNGIQGDGQSWYPAISANGRFVSFQSDAANLVSGDGNGTGDVFIVELDITAATPTTPFGLNLDSNDDDGSSNTDNITGRTSGLTISGAGGIAGGRLVLFDDKNNSGTIDAGEAMATAYVTNAAWSADMALAVGSHSIKAIQDDGSNRSKPSAALMITVTGAAPPLAAPSELDLAAADDSGQANDDDITKNTSALTISGIGVKGAVLTLFNDRNDNGQPDSNELLGTVSITATTGKWSKDINLTAGVHAIRAIQKKGSETSEVSEALMITVDPTSPQALVVPVVTTATARISKASGSGTSSGTTLGFSGSGEVGAMVTLFADKNNNRKQDTSEKPLLKVPVGSNGQWRSDNLALAIGSYSLYAFQTDLAGNVGALSDRLTLTVGPNGVITGAT